MNKWNLIKERIRNATRSARGKDILLYLMCVVAAFFFWLFLSFDGEVQRNFEIPISIAKVPDSIHILDNPPRTISVSVQGKGFSFVRYEVGKVDQMSIPFSELKENGHRYCLQKNRLESLLHGYFGQNILIHSIKPDSISLTATNLPGKKVGVSVEADISPSYRSAITGKMTVDPDTVVLYSTQRVPQNISSIYTDLISEHDLTDTLRVSDVRLKVPDGMVSYPSTVRVTVPVEPLISKKKNVEIEVINAPVGRRLMLFPYSVTVLYLVPMSMYNKDMSLSAYVDYNSIDFKSRMINVHVASVNPNCRSISYSPEKVEYIIEDYSSK